MPKYAVFFTFTGQSVQALMDRPSDRAAVVRSLAESVGGRMECYYLMFGERDGFAVLDLPDSATAGLVTPWTAFRGRSRSVAASRQIGSCQLPRTPLKR